MATGTLGMVQIGTPDEPKEYIFNTETLQGNQLPDNKKSTNDVVDAPDGGWGWVVLFSAWMVNIINVGVIMSWGLFYAELQAKFQASLTTVSWLGSIYNGIASISGLVNPLIIERIGCRMTGLIGVTLLCSGFFSSMFVNNIYILYITASIIPGIGHRMQHLTSMMIVSKYFYKKRPLAIGVLSSGGALGSIIVPVFVTFLLKTFRLWGTFWLIGGIFLNEYCCDLTYRPLKNEGNINPRASSMDIKQYLALLKTSKMVLLLLSGLLQGLVQHIFSSFIPTISMRTIDGLTMEQAAFILAMSGILSMLSRVVFGGISTVLHRHVLHMYIASLCGSGIVVAIVTLTTSYSVLLIVAATYGVFQGGIWALQATVVHQLFEFRVFTYAYGLLLLAFGLASLVGVPSASFLAELSGDDMTLFYTATTGFVLSGLVLLPLTFSRRHYQTGHGDTDMRTEVKLTSRL